MSNLPRNNCETSTDFNNLTREDLIFKIRTLQAHNNQLKNILAKSQRKTKKSHRNAKPYDFTKCNFRHVLLKFFYLGWNYDGYATQEDTANTIEHNLFEALVKTCLIKDRQSSNYHRCGRTDKGVSSFGQVVSIDLRSKFSSETDDDRDPVNEIDYCTILNRVLPTNIQCLAWCPADDTFSARFNCKGRTYKYFFPKGTLNIDKMKMAAHNLIGIHDFRNFCKMDVGNGVVEFIRYIYDVNITSLDEQLADDDDYGMYVITIEGKAFLWHQIRYIMGILLLVGQNREDPSIVQELLDVEKNPRKPDYNMASELPLNLYHCAYDQSNWFYNQESLSVVIRHLQTIWTLTTVKSKMIKSMLTDLESKLIDKSKMCCLSNSLIQGVRSKNYTPVMKRTQCESLEDRIEHFAKRNKAKMDNEN